MSLLREIPDKGATLAWSPVPAHPSLVALGAKDGAGVGFDSYGGQLELYKLDLKSREANADCVSTVQTNSRFSNLAWSRMTRHSAKFPYGIIAGGMSDGVVNVWDPALLVEQGGAKAQLSKVQRHKGAVRGLQFNPHSDNSHLLASGTFCKD